MFSVSYFINEEIHTDSKVNDVKDVGDIVIGVTGKIEEGEKAERIAGLMNFGDIYISKEYFICISCYSDKNYK